MDVQSLVTRVRDHYVEQFEQFVERQREICARGAPEVKFELSDPASNTKLFHKLYCADFVRNDAGSIVVAFEPADILSFDTISGSLGSMGVAIERLRWDDVVIQHDLKVMPGQELSDWFKRWFDPEDERFELSGSDCGVIHSLIIDTGMLSIDFGTAPADAFWELLNVLESAGASKVRVGSGSAESDTIH